MGCTSQFKWAVFLSLNPAFFNCSRSSLFSCRVVRVKVGTIRWHGFSTITMQWDILKAYSDTTPLKWKNQFGMAQNMQFKWIHLNDNAFQALLAMADFRPPWGWPCGGSSALKRPLAEHPSREWCDPLNERPRLIPGIFFSGKLHRPQTCYPRVILPWESLRWEITISLGKHMETSSIENQ